LVNAELPGASLQGDDQEQIIKLAAQIAIEKDPNKFQALVSELNDLLEERERRLNKQVNHSQDQQPNKS
jgi:hypothetical protein